MKHRTPADGPRGRATRAWVFVATVLVSPPVGAFAWPDVVDQIDRELSSPDAGVRRSAADKLHSLRPAVAAPLVLRGLHDSDLEVRITASRAAMLGRIAGATEVVLGWLGEREAPVRVAACEVAGALPNPRAVAPLARALGDSEATVRAAAASALGGQDSKEAVAPLLGRLDDSNPAVRVQIARALAHLGDLRAVVPLVGKLQDSVPEVRKSVARALGELGDSRASQPLAQELRDGSIEVRVAALAALGQIHADDSVDAIAAMASDKSPLLRQAAAAALGHIGSANAVRALVGLLGTADDARAGLEQNPLRDALVSAGAAAVDPLRGLLAFAPTAAAATSAAWVLGELRSTASAPDIIRAMRKSTLPTTAALHALAKAGSPDAMAVALEFVDDPSPSTRAEAFGAVATLLDPARPDGRAVEPLAAALHDGRLSAVERAHIASLLGRTGAPRARQILVTLLPLRDEALKLATIDALGALGPSDADAPLLHLLDDADPAVRLHAAVALADAGGAEARDVLISRLGRSEDLDRSAALTALAGILARAPSEGAVTFLARTLLVADGPERDALILAIGRADTPGVPSTIQAILRSPNADDRRTLATVLAARRGSAGSLPALRALLADPDPTVRAEAAWSIGEIAGPAELGALTPLLEGTSAFAAIDAAAAIARIAARTTGPDLAVTALCPLLGHSRSYVRANAAAGLALASARCGDGSIERRILAEDAEPARAAAARAIARRPLGPVDLRALERCTTNDRSGAVAHRCREGTRAASGSTHSVELYIASGTTSEPHPGSAFVAEFADGLLRAGRTDRRGAVFDAQAPEGDVSLIPLNVQSR